MVSRAGRRRSAQHVRLRREPLGRTGRGRARHGLDPVVDHHNGHRSHRRGVRRAAHPRRHPIILGANVGTTVTTTLVALSFIGSRTEFRRALGASTIHDFYNWLALLIFFPLEPIWQPLERISGALTNALYGTGWLPDPDRFNFVRVITRPVVDGVTKATTPLSTTPARCSPS